MANITRRTGYGGAPRRAMAAAPAEGPPEAADDAEERRKLLSLAGSIVFLFSFFF